MATPEEVRDAMIEKLKAEAEHFKSEAAKSNTERLGLKEMARQAKAQADTAELMVRQNERTEQELLAQNKYHLVYTFDQPVGSGSVKDCIHQLTEWSRTRPGADLEIIFNSPGGKIVDGMALFDFIRYLRTKDHKITTSTIGYAASMAGILLQAGDHRVMGREAWLLIHQGSFGVVGTAGEVEDTVAWMKQLQNRILDIFVERSKLTKKQLQHRWQRKDWWISSQEALKLGFVDEVR